MTIGSHTILLRAYEISKDIESGHKICDLNRPPRIHIQLNTVGIS